MLRPFWCNDSTATLRTLDDWAGIHGDLCPRHPMQGRVTVACVYGRQSRRRLSFTMMVHGGHWGAPRVMAALAGLVHDRESAADYEHNHDKNSY